MAHKLITKAITFDDILLVPAESKVLPRDVNVSTKLTKNIRLNIPDYFRCYGYCY